MTTAANRRCFPRIDSCLPVRVVTSVGKPSPGHSLDIGPRGLCLGIEGSVGVGQSVFFIVDLPDGAALEMTGIVRWATAVNAPGATPLSRCGVMLQGACERWFAFISSKAQEDHLVRRLGRAA